MKTALITGKISGEPGSYPQVKTNNRGEHVVSFYIECDNFTSNRKTKLRVQAYRGMAEALARTAQAGTPISVNAEIQCNDLADGPGPVYFNIQQYDLTSKSNQSEALDIIDDEDSGEVAHTEEAPKPKGGRVHADAPKEPVAA